MEFSKKSLEHLGFKEGQKITGDIAVDKEKNIFVPAQLKTEFENKFKIDFPIVKEGVNKPGIAESVYIFGDEEIAKSSEKNSYVSASDNLFVNNGGGGKSEGGFEVALVEENPWIPDMKKGDRVTIIADRTKQGFATIYPQERDKMSGKLLENYAEIYGEGIAFGDDGNDYFWKDGKYISVYDSKKKYSENSGVDMHVITKLAYDDAEMVGVLITAQGKTSYFDTTTKTTDEFQAEYKKIGREAILKENPILSRKSLVEGRVRKDTSKFLENPQAEAVAKDMTKNIKDIKSFQRETLHLWEQKVIDEESDKIYQDILVANNQGNLDIHLKATGINPSFKSNEVNNYQEYENAIIGYQINRQALIDGKIIRASDASFPNYFSPIEENEIYKIMTNQNLNYDQAVVAHLQNNNLLIGARALLKSPEFKTISVWKTNYGTKDMREEFQSFK